MTDITIPPAALEAGARTLCNEQRLFWHGLTTESQDIIRGEARAAFRAIVAAERAHLVDIPDTIAALDAALAE
jgi:hypothetical protein